MMPFIRRNFGVASGRLSGLPNFRPTALTGQEFLMRHRAEISFRIEESITIVDGRMIGAERRCSGLAEIAQSDKPAEIAAAAGTALAEIVPSSGCSEPGHIQICLDCLIRASAELK